MSGTGGNASHSRTGNSNQGSDVTEELKSLPENVRKFYESNIRGLRVVGLDFKDLLNAFVLPTQMRYCFKSVCLGRGSTSATYSAIEVKSMDTDQPQEVAIKRVLCNKGDQHDQNHQKEIKVFQMVNDRQHSHIIRYFTTFSDYESPVNSFTIRHYLVTELSQIGDMTKIGYQTNDQNKKVWMAIEENYCRHLIRGIARGVQCLHELGIAHGDIKLDNILLFWSDPQLVSVKEYKSEHFSSMVPKLIDFNHSEIGEPGGVIMMQRPRCTINTAAPESYFTVKPYDMIAADVYSVGVVLLSLLLGCHPFAPPAKLKITDEATYARFTIDNKRAVWKLTAMIETFANPLRELLRTTLALVPEKRITIHEFLSNQWFQSEDN